MKLHGTEDADPAKYDAPYVGRAETDAAPTPIPRLDLYVETLGELEGKLKDLLHLSAVLALHAAQLPDDRSTGLGEFTAQSESANIIATVADARRRVQTLLYAEVRKQAELVERSAAVHAALARTKDFVTDAGKDAAPPAELSEVAKKHLGRAEAFGQAASEPPIPALVADPVPPNPVPYPRADCEF